MNANLKLGGEITSAIRNKFELRRGQLQVLGGGNYAVRKDTTFDFGIVAGHFAASPRLGVLVGMSGCGLDDHRFKLSDLPSRSRAPAPPLDVGAFHYGAD